MIDHTGTGKIKYDDFMKWWRTENKFGKLELDDKQQEALHRSATYFQYFDKDHSGTISAQEFASLHADLVKNKLTTKDLQTSLQDLDEDNDGVIEFNEYIDWLIRIGSIPIKGMF